LRPSSLHWKEWATALRLDYSQRERTPKRTTVVSASSSWPTATAHDARRPGPDLKSTQGGNLCREAATWPTPMAGTPAQNGNNYAGNNDFSRGVMAIVSQWETPSVAVTEGSRLTRGGARSSEKLLTGQAVEVSAWPTPAARDFKGGGNAVTRKDGKSRMDMLDWKAERGFSLPPVQPTPRGLRSSDPRRISLRLYLMLMSPKPSSWKKLRAWAGRVTRRKLNPSFVDWMHGWPSEWTDSERAVTGFRHWLLLSRGELSRLLSPPNADGQLSLFE
jgi:hypothetical protein